jgi:RND superfamily putative drug exporter
MILFLLLRSVFIPIRLILTILMSILWAVGFLILLFQFYIGMGIYWIIPILLFSLLMGLGMDYDIFLVSRIKEEVGRGRSDEDAIVRSVEKTGLVITACGLILAAALGTLMLSSSYILIESGFTLSLAILLDTFLVRIFLVPSIMMVLKKWNWWPSKPKVVEEL